MDRYKFILTSFGLQYVKPMLYKKGQTLTQSDSFLNADIGDIPYEFDRLNSGGENQKIMSPLGTPVFADIKLGNKANTSEIQLIWALCTVNLLKNIVKTSIQGRNGTVKEYINMGDYSITIQGGLFDENPSRYPYEQSYKLVQLSKLGESLKATSEFLQLFDITDIVIEDVTFTQVSGRQNVQLFNIQALSDQPIELIEE